MGTAKPWWKFEWFLEAIPQGNEAQMRKLVLIEVLGFLLIEVGFWCASNVPAVSQAWNQMEYFLEWNGILFTFSGIAICAFGIVFTVEKTRP